MSHGACRWWCGYTFDNVLRRWLLYRPEVLFAPYVRPGMTVLDAGCGMGFNAIGLARLVGESGRVLAVDLQAQMLAVLKRRASRAGVPDRIEARQCTADAIGVDGVVDLAVAFWVVHEVPDMRRLFEQVRACLNPGGRFFVAEPKGHVGPGAFSQMLATAAAAGFHVEDEPRVRLSRAVLLGATKPPW